MIHAAKGFETQSWVGNAWLEKYKKDSLEFIDSSTLRAYHC